jgi:uncharacterized membrane protein YjjP (DUF1212 family)
MKALENLRAWKNRIFPDWLWDILVGGACGLVGLLTGVNWLVLVVPFVVTAINQAYNKVFEWKDAALRMIVPVILFMILIILK